MSLLLLVGCQTTRAEQIDSVGTVLKWSGSDHGVVVEVFDDPDVQNMTYYISRTKTSGIRSELGLAEGTSDTTISYQQVGPIELTDKIKNGKSQGDVIFQERTSLVFKKLQIMRFYDAKHNTLVYLTYSDKVVDDSPRSAISATPITPWNK